MTTSLMRFFRHREAFVYDSHPGALSTKLDVCLDTSWMFDELLAFLVPTQLALKDANVFTAVAERSSNTVNLQSTRAKGKKHVYTNFGQCCILHTNGVEH